MGAEDEAWNLETDQVATEVLEKQLPCVLETLIWGRARVGNGELGTRVL